MLLFSNLYCRIQNAGNVVINHITTSFCQIYFHEFVYYVIRAGVARLLSDSIEKEDDSGNTEDSENSVCHTAIDQSISVTKEY